MKNKLRNRVECYFFCVGLILFFFSNVIAKYLFKLRSMVSESEGNAIYSPVENPITRLTGLLALVAFLLIIASGIVAIIRILKGRGTRLRNEG